MKHITIETTVNELPIKTWDMFYNQKDIENFHTASSDWECTDAYINFEEWNHFTYTLAKKDGSESFDLQWEFLKIHLYEKVVYKLTDWRKVKTEFFEDVNNTTKIVQTIDIEEINSPEVQKAWWQAILQNFKHYIEQKIV